MILLRTKCWESSHVDPVGKATMKEGQQISVEEYYSMVLLEGACCFICQKEKNVQIYIYKKGCKAPTTLEKWIELHSITIQGLH